MQTALILVSCLSIALASSLFPALAGWKDTPKHKKKLTEVTSYESLHERGCEVLMWLISSVFFESEDDQDSLINYGWTCTEHVDFMCHDVWEGDEGMGNFTEKDFIYWLNTQDEDMQNAIGALVFLCGEKGEDDADADADRAVEEDKSEIRLLNKMMQKFKK